jgi:predicted DNA-binding protein
MDTTLTIRLPRQLSEWLDEQAQATGLSKGQIIRDQIELSRIRKVRQPCLDLAGSFEP